MNDSLHTIAIGSQPTASHPCYLQLARPSFMIHVTHLSSVLAPRTRSAKKCLFLNVLSTVDTEVILGQLSLVGTTIAIVFLYWKRVIHWSHVECVVVSRLVAHTHPTQLKINDYWRCLSPRSVGFVTTEYPLISSHNGPNHGPYPAKTGYGPWPEPFRWFGNYFGPNKTANYKRC